MLYSGADLIRTSNLQHERMERLEAMDSVKPVAASDNPASTLDDQTQNALLRFARFIHKEGEKKKPLRSVRKSHLKNPYVAAEEREVKLFSRGQTLDVYV